MKTTVKCITAALFLFAILFAVPSVLAAGAVSVELNGVILNAANPYWKNGGGGSAADWNAYFDPGTSTPILFLKNAEINTLNTYDELIYADGDIHIILLGSSSLTYTGSGSITPAGIVADGDLTVSDGTADGTGSLTIEINPGAPMFIADGLLTETGDIVINSGTIDITLYSGFESYGIYAEYDLYIHGGAITVYSYGLAVSAVSAVNFNMTGGSIHVTTDAGLEDSHALLFYQALMTGGIGRFQSEAYGYGAVWVDAASGSFRVTDGQMVFSSLDEALYFETSEVLTPTVTDTIYASNDENGIGKFVWDSSMDILAGHLSDTSPYRYVELLGKNTQPETGDESRPLMWIAIAAAALLAGTGIVLLLRRKQ